MGFITSSSVALITGGSKGIGKAIAEEVLKQGGIVCLLDVDEKEGKAAISSFHTSYPPSSRAIFIPCNVMDDAQLASAFKKCFEKYGRIDLVVNNAGIGDRTMISDEKAAKDEMPDDWKAIIGINLTALINGTRLGYKYMRASPQPSGGVILNISSLGGFIPQPYSAVYCATKHAVVGYTRSLGYLRKYGIRVTALSPGFTDTNLVSSGRANSEIFRTMIETATAHSGGLIPVSEIVKGAFICIDDEDKTMSGKVLSVSRELGFVIHETPMLYSKDKVKEVGMKAQALPHKFLRDLPPAKEEDKEKMKQIKAKL